MRKVRLLTLLGAIIVILIGVTLEMRWRKSSAAKHAPPHQISTAEMIERARRATKDSMIASEQRSNSRWARKRQQPASTPAPSQTSDVEPDSYETDPIAHEAVVYVGIDPRATEYWIEAINDPDVPERERQELIENLRVAGIANQQLPAEEMLAVLTNRINIIEAIAGEALDETNTEAFSVAHRDLVQLATALSQQTEANSGEPDGTTAPDPAESDDQQQR